MWICGFGYIGQLDGQFEPSIVRNYGFRYGDPDIWGLSVGVFAMLRNLLGGIMSRWLSLEIG